MLNSFIVVGRITSVVKNKECNGTDIVLGITRNFKDKNGDYNTDFITILVIGEIEKTINSYCKKGDLIGCKGLILTNLDTKEMYLKCEKLTFLSGASEK